MEGQIYKSMIGKRVLVLWTDKARCRGADWIAFRVIDAGPDFVWLQGVDAPDGSKHDGTKVAAMESEIWDMIEWKESE